MARNKMSEERINDDKETVKGFHYLGNALNGGSGTEMTKNNNQMIEISRMQRSFVMEKSFH